MILYKESNCVDAQIEGAGINLRLGYTCLGVAPNDWHKVKYKQGLAAKWFPRLYMAFNYHTHQCDQWMYFDFSFFGIARIYCQSWGERSKCDHIGNWGGLHIKLMKKHWVL